MSDDQDRYIDRKKIEDKGKETFSSNVNSFICLLCMAAVWFYYYYSHCFLSNNSSNKERNYEKI